MRPRSSSASSCAALGFPDRGIRQRSDFTGFNWADVPVILVELGFMTNPVEDRALARADRHGNARRSGSVAVRSPGSVCVPTALRDLDRAKDLG